MTIALVWTVVSPKAVAQPRKALPLLPSLRTFGVLSTQRKSSHGTEETSAFRLGHWDSAWLALRDKLPPTVGRGPGATQGGGPEGAEETELLARALPVTGWQVRGTASLPFPGVLPAGGRWPPRSRAPEQGAGARLCASHPSSVSSRVSDSDHPFSLTKLQSPHL